jgi:putative NIF3 family GTP cyclohydrolase 1 type 2
MDRRKFIFYSGLGVAGTLWPLKGRGTSVVKNLTAGDIQTYLRSLIDVEEPSVDRFIIGDPDTEVKKIGTAWMPYWRVLKEADRTGVNVMVVHEPTFYTHLDLEAEKWDYLDAPAPARDQYMILRDRKKKWIEEKGMVIIRCHDVLDKVPGWGIPYAFGQGLGFRNEQIIRSKTFYNVYQIEPKPAGEVAKEMAERLKAVGQPGVAFYGYKDYRVKTVGLGTGCICNPLDYSELEPDLFIGIDDTIRTWVQTAWAEDSGRPLIVVNHGTSEEFGVRSLNKHLKEHYKDHEVIHFPTGCSYKWITA